MSKRTSKYFDADRPIECRQQDRLGRRSFAEAITRQVRAVPTEHGFTIAVVGEWGSGKTSVLNMVAETLEDDEDAIAILQFNPWLFGRAEDLVARFFRELSAQLGQGHSEKLKDVAKALSKLGQSLAPLSPVTGMTGAANLFAKLTDLWTKPPSLHDKRDHLKEALAASDSRVVVLIDDIDRLEASETRELMRVVFLLAFDRRHVARSLGENEIEGRQYLDKIVQVSYDLPNVREAILPGMLLPWLDELIRDCDLAQLDKDVWGRVFYDVIKPLLGNLRDVKRYLYSIPVTLDTIGQEVALADLLGLEVLRVLGPAMFVDIRAQSEYLVHSKSQSQRWVSEEERTRHTQEELAAMLERAGHERGVMESVFEILFPATQGFLDRPSYGSAWDRTWRKRRRVACDEVLRVYLQAGLDEGALPSRDVQHLVEALTDEEELMRLLDTLGDQQFEAALERLADFEQDFPVEAVQTAVPVLVNRMSRLSKHPSSFLGLSPRFKAVYVISRLVRRIEDGDALMDKMHEVLEKVDSLSGWLHLVEMVGHRESGGLRLVGEEQAKMLENPLVVRLESSTVEQLTGEWDLFALSVRTLLWLDGEDKERLAAILCEHLGDDRFVLALLLTSFGYVHYSTGRVEERLPWDTLIETFGDRLVDAVNRLAGSQLRQDLSEAEQNTISLAQRYALGWHPQE